MDEYVFKLVLIGDKMVGKSSLIRRYVHGSFEGRYTGTIGLNVSTKKQEFDNKIINLNIYDIEAEASFEQLFAPFASGSSGAVIVFDLSRPETLTSVNNWVQRLKSVINSIDNLILIGNKSDLKDQRKITENEAKVYSKNHLMLDYVETSAKFDVHVDKAFEILGRRFLVNALKDN